MYRTSATEAPHRRIGTFWLAERFTAPVVLCSVPPLCVLVGTAHVMDVRSPSAHGDAAAAACGGGGATNQPVRCRYGSGTATPARHVGGRPALPCDSSGDHRALGGSEVARAAAGASSSSSSDDSASYRGFRTAGRGGACGKETARGDSGAVTQHKDDCMDARTEVDVRRHFISMGGGAEVTCRHCHAVRCGRNMKAHMAACPELPEQVRRAFDESEVARAAAGAGMYGSNPLYRDFEVTGWRVARCKACLRTVRGNSGHLMLHGNSCPGFPATWTEVDVGRHFSGTGESGRRKCRYSVQCCGVTS